MYVNSRFGGFLYQLKNFCVANLDSRVKDAKTESIDVLLSKLSLYFFDKIMASYSETTKDFLRRLLDTVAKLASRLRCN